MADTFFLHKSRVQPDQLIQLGSGAALEQHAVLVQFLQQRVGRSAADLFAEPVLSRGNGASETMVSWYVAHSDDGKPLGDLPSDQREAVEKQLSQLLASISETLSDPDLGPLVGSALHIQDANSVWAVGGKPVLLNWAMMADAATASVASRDVHFKNTLGAFLPLAAAPAISAAEWNARGYGAADSSADGAQLAESPAAPEVGTNTPVVAAGAASTAIEADPSVWRWRWIAPIALLVLFLAMLIWIVLPGNLLYPPRPATTVIDDGNVADAVREANRSLEQRLGELQVALDGAVCTPSGELELPNGYSLDGRFLPELPPSGEQTDQADQARGPEPIQQAPLVPPPPSQLVQPGQDGGDPARLLDTIKERTALVLAQGNGSGGHGTGFFIGPDLLVTNHHVIETALNGGQIGVTNDALGRVTIAEVVAHSGPLEQTGADFAILRLPGANMAFYEIANPQTSMQLQQVIAAGYPAFVLETDAQFQNLMQGDASAMPGLVITDGTVNAEQNLSPNTRVMIHTAHISPGNSGGPLVDGCGRVVGVNTFIRNDESSLNSLNFSLASADLIGFLSQNGVSASITSSECVPNIERPDADVAPEAENDAQTEPEPEAEAQ